MFDLELEFEHLIYIFIFSITWLFVAFWGSTVINSIYNVVPLTLSIFISASYWIGGIGILLGIGLIIYTVLE